MRREQPQGASGVAAAAIGIAFKMGMRFALIRWAKASVSTRAQSPLVPSTLEYV